MTVRHHPDISTLMSHAAGSLGDAMSLVVACHLEHCTHCQSELVSAEMLGSALLEESVPVEMSSNASADMLALLDADIPTLPRLKTTVIQPSSNNSDNQLPRALSALTGHTQFSDIAWRPLAPGLKQVQLSATDGKLRLLKIAPGTCMPSHGHSGTELTLVLKGSYTDECGRFQAGDLADLDPDTNHQPVADTHEGCICLISTDAPLRFDGLVPRLLQPFFGL